MKKAIKSIDISAGAARRGYIEVVRELNSRFPNVDEIVTEKDKKDFAKLFGEYLKVENILQNYDEFTRLKPLQSLDMDDLKSIHNYYSFVLVISMSRYYYYSILFCS